MRNFHGKMKRLFEALSAGPFYVFYRLVLWNSNKMRYMFCKTYIKRLSALQKSINEKYDCSVVKLDTYDGYNQANHPDVIRGTNGELYLFCTPFPYGHEKYENPSVYQKINNSFLPVTTPICAIESKNCRSNYLSDSDGIFYNGNYIVVFREYRFIEQSHVLNIFKTCSSKDMKEWTAPRELLVFETTELSPSFLVAENTLWVYYVSYSSTTSKVNRIQYDNTNNKAPVTLENIPDKCYIWHIDIINSNNQYYCLCVLKDRSKKGTTLHLFTSINGLHFFYKKRINIEKKIQTSRGKIVNMYRSSMVQKHDNIFDVYISIMLDNKVWQIINIDNMQID